MVKKSDIKNKNSAPIVGGQKKQPNKENKLKKQQAAKIKKVVKDSLVKTPAPKSPKIGESPKVVKKEEKKQNKPAQKAQKNVNGAVSSPEKKANAVENGKVPSDKSPSEKSKTKIEKTVVKTEGTNDSAKPTEAKSSKKPNKKKTKKASVDIKNLNGTPAQTVFVGNLPTNTKRIQLTKLFAPYGKVLSIRFRTANGKVIFKHKARKEAGVLNAYIVLDTAESAAKALELNGTTFKDNHLRVRKTDKHDEHYEPKCTVFIGNLKYSANDEKLHQIFSSCGEIDYVRSLQGDKGCIGVAYVCFKKPDSVGLALELNGTMLDERPIKVERYSTTKLGGKKADFRSKMQYIGKKVLERGKKDPSSFKKKTPAIRAKYAEKGGETKNGKKPFKKGSPKKNLAGDEKKKKSEFRGVKSNVVKKNPKKKLPTHLKKLASKIAPKDD